MHLKATENFTELRKQQTEFIMNVLSEHMNEISLKKQCLCICGDFNGERIEEFYNVIVRNKSFQNEDSFEHFFVEN